MVYQFILNISLLEFHLYWISCSRNIADHKATTPFSWCVGITSMHQEPIMDLHMIISEKHLDILKFKLTIIIHTELNQYKIIYLQLLRRLCLKLKLYLLYCSVLSCHIKRIQQNPCKWILTDICPARRGQSMAFSFSTSSSGISWLTVNILPMRLAWQWGKRPEQWLPENEPNLEFIPIL